MHYLFFALAIAASLVILFALVLCFKAPAPRHKWLWALLVVFGLVHLSFTTVGGSYSLASIVVAFLRPGVLQGELSEPSQPAVVIPISALAFLARRRSLVAHNGS